MEFCIVEVLKRKINQINLYTVIIQYINHKNQNLENYDQFYNASSILL